MREQRIAGDFIKFQICIYIWQRQWRKL